MKLNWTAKQYSVWLKNHDWPLHNQPMNLEAAIELFEEYEDDGYDDVFIWDNVNKTEINRHALMHYED